MVAVQHSDCDIMRALELLMRFESEVPAEGIHKIKLTKPLTERERMKREGSEYGDDEKQSISLVLVLFL